MMQSNTSLIELENMMAELENKFSALDNAYKDNNFFEDDKVIEILKLHRILEARYVTDDSNNPPIEKGWLDESFHKENIMVLDYIISNVSGGNQNIDALIYLYPYLIYRYTSNNGEFFPTTERFRKYADRIMLALGGGGNIGQIYSLLTRSFLTRKIHNYSQEFVEQLLYVNDNNWQYIFRCCCVFLYDKEFCNTQYFYEGAMHKGSFILFDTILFKILTWRCDDKERWVNKFVNYFSNEETENFEVVSIPNYYSMYAKLYRCHYLSLDSNNHAEELRLSLNDIVLPPFAVSENIHYLFRLYFWKMLCLENIHQIDEVLDMCNSILPKLKQDN